MMIDRASSHLTKLTAVLLLLSFTLLLAGCTPAMRKKFIRKKKAEQEADQVIPVLDPVDYPAPSFDPQKAYQRAHNLARVWYKDLVTAYDEGGSDKRVRGQLEQIRVQLENLRSLLIPGARAEVQQALDVIGDIRAEISRPEAMRTRSVMKRKMRNLDEMIRYDLAYKKMKDSLVQDD
ncbi:MAG: hypothetical protein ACLFPX_02940 [Candidatus Omnitrophota bacterium]